jgi:hypothetical protein
MRPPSISGPSSADSDNKIFVNLVRCALSLEMGKLSEKVDEVFDPNQNGVAENFEMNKTYRGDRIFKKS